MSFSLLISYFGLNEFCTLVSCATRRIGTRSPNIITLSVIITQLGLMLYSYCFPFQYDVHLCGYTALLRIVARFHDEIFSDASSPTGLNKVCSLFVSPTL